MKVVFLSVSWPREMQDYVRGLAAVGAQVLGVGSDPVHGIPPHVRACLHDYLQVPNIMAEDDVIARVSAWTRGTTVDRVEALWEPVVILAARLRERLGCPGMSLDTVMGFRDKQLMKERVAAAGLRVPHAFRVRSADDARKAAARIGFPLILKPIAGAGSADTFRVDDAKALDAILGRMGHVREASCEEFVEGDEFTYDTVCIDGRPAYENVAQYLPRPLIARTEHWISPCIVTLRDLEDPGLKDGIALGRGVLDALSMGTGFTHMEWYRKADGEVVFGEIGCRPGGAHLVDQMNYTGDIDLFVEWARAVVHGRFEASTARKHHCAIVFKRAHGEGVIHHIAGLDGFLARNRGHVCTEQLLRPGSRRRDWKQTLLSDGFVIVRHPDLHQCLRIAREVQEGVQLYAR
ncbi:MAG: hypothetical protein H6742_15065 [Alphaproteobacteria bacterium]|nr:hypothetical protein [Alphaproteobacteria bacterium]